MNFGMGGKRKQKQYSKERVLPSWKEMMIWKDFKPLYVNIFRM
jgi:hypothetical protein